MKFLKFARGFAPVTENLPNWVTVMPTPKTNDVELNSLDQGERAAIALAERLNPTLILMDDRAGVTCARSRGFKVTGTLGLLKIAATRGLLDLAAALERLKTTNFRYWQEMFDELLRNKDAE